MTKTTPNNVTEHVQETAIDRQVEGLVKHLVPNFKEGQIIKTVNFTESGFNYFLEEIKQALLTVQKEERENIPVGFLRQWLNEDRITDKNLVTDEQLLTFIKLGYE